MTALPNSFDFATLEQASTPVLVRPNVVERYWGYTIAKNELDIDLAVLTRLVASLIMVGAFLAAVGVWMLPEMVFSGAAPMTKGLISVTLLAVAGGLFRLAFHSTRVRVQIDTANGELREVVSGLFGSDSILARYGFDAVEAVTVVASKLDPSIGQLQIALKGNTKIPAGDGSMIALRHLRDRVATDCGLEHHQTRTAAIWMGPISA